VDIPAETTATVALSERAHGGRAGDRIAQWRRCGADAAGPRSV